MQQEERIKIGFNKICIKSRNSQNSCSTSNQDPHSSPPSEHMRYANIQKNAPHHGNTLLLCSVRKLILLTHTFLTSIFVLKKLNLHNIPQTRNATIRPAAMTLTSPCSTPYTLLVTVEIVADHTCPAKPKLIVGPQSCHALLACSGLQRRLRVRHSQQGCPQARDRK